MNKCTRAIDDDTYKLIIATIQNGFEYAGINHKSNERIATVLQLEYNLGLRVGDIKPDDGFIRERWWSVSA